MFYLKKEEDLDSSCVRIFEGRSLQYVGLPVGETSNDGLKSKKCLTSRQKYFCSEGQQNFYKVDLQTSFLALTSMTKLFFQA